eukprot:1195737-Prorocentrum_minimum.AAC.9
MHQEEVAAWQEGPLRVSKYAKDLVQLDNGKKIPPNPSDWVCEVPQLSLSPPSAWCFVFAPRRHFKVHGLSMRCAKPCGLLLWRGCTGERNEGEPVVEPFNWYHWLRSEKLGWVGGYGRSHEPFRGNWCRELIHPTDKPYLLWPTLCSHVYICVDCRPNC